MSRAYLVETPDGIRLEQIADKVEMALTERNIQIQAACSCYEAEADRQRARAEAYIWRFRVLLFVAAGGWMTALALFLWAVAR